MIEQSYEVSITLRKPPQKPTRHSSHRRRQRNKGIYCYYWHQTSCIYLGKPYVPAVNRSTCQKPQAANQRLEGYFNTQISCSNKAEPCYTNSIHKDGRTLLCMVRVEAFAEAMSKTHGSSSSLETIWRIQICNDDTQKIIRHKQAKRRPNPGHTFIDINGDESDFFALVGTDNGKSTLRLLEKYPAMFGRKRISGVRIEETDLCWFLQEVLVPVPRPDEPENPDRPLSNRKKYVIGKENVYLKARK